MRRPVVIIESPFAGQIERNLAYARAAMRDCIQRGETPLASHLLYTQPGILDDQYPEQRQLGIEMGFQLWGRATHICFYVDLGWSTGMKAARERFFDRNRPDFADHLELEERQLPGWLERWDERAERDRLAGSLFVPRERITNPDELRPGDPVFIKPAP